MNTHSILMCEFGFDKKKMQFKDALPNHPIPEIYPTLDVENSLCRILKLFIEK